MGAMVPLAAEREIISAIRVRTQWRGSSTEVARQFGISRSHLLGLRNGNARLTAPIAARILAKIREEELALADRIEAELYQGNCGEGI